MHLTYFCCFACIWDGLATQYGLGTELPSVSAPCPLPPCVPAPKGSRKARLDFPRAILITVQLLIIPLLLKYRDFSVLGAGRRKGKSILSQECVNLFLPCFAWCCPDLS